MKTYTMEVDGTPLLAFRARDDDEAATFPNRIYSPTSMFKRPEGAITVRLATISERAAWTAYSVWKTEDDEDDEADDDPNGLMVSLELWGEDENEDEEEEEVK